MMQKVPKDKPDTTRPLPSPFIRVYKSTQPDYATRVAGMVKNLQP